MNDCHNLKVVGDIQLAFLKRSLSTKHSPTFAQEWNSTAYVRKKSEQSGNSSTVKAAAKGLLNKKHTRRHSITLNRRPLDVNRQKDLLNFSLVGSS